MSLLGNARQQRFAAAAALVAVPAVLLWRRRQGIPCEPIDRGLLWGLVVLGVLLAWNP